VGKEEKLKFGRLKGGAVNVRIKQSLSKRFGWRNLQGFGTA